MRSKNKFLSHGQAAALVAAKQRCRGVVASAGVCESCVKVPGVAQHHGVHKSDQRAKLNPLLLLDPELQFWLCTECHTVAVDAPHVDNQAFLDKMEAKGGHRAQKARKILQANSGPLVTVKTRDIDFNEILQEVA